MKKSRYFFILGILVFLFTGCPQNVMHTVNFETDGGTKIESVLVQDGNSVEKPANPTKTDFTFEGWYLNDVAYDFSKPVTEDITLKAKWKAVEKEVGNPSDDLDDEDDKKTDDDKKPADDEKTPADTEDKDTSDDKTTDDETGKKDVDPEENEYLDLRNRLREAPASRNIARSARAISYIGDENYVVTEPVKDFTNLNPDLKNWLINQNPNLFTDAVISKMFKLSPVEDGVKITYTRPQEVMGLYGINVFLLDKKMNDIVTQQIVEELGGMDFVDSLEWVFPFTDPNYTDKDGKNTFIIQFFACDPDHGWNTQVNLAYRAYCGGGKGRPDDLPSKEKILNHSVIKNNVHQFEKVMLPEESDLTLKYTIIGLPNNSTETFYPMDENGEALYKLITTKSISLTKENLKKTSFDLSLIGLDGYASLKDYPYITVRKDITYKREGYIGIFNGSALFSMPCPNAYFDIPTHIRKNQSIKEAYYSLGQATESDPGNVNNAYFDISELIESYSDKFLCINISADNAGTWGGLTMNWIDPYLDAFVTTDDFNRTFSYKISDLVKIADVKKYHEYTLCFNSINKAPFTVGDITLKDPVTVTLNANGGTPNKTSVEVPTGCYITDKLPAPLYDSKFFGGWYIDEDCTNAFDGVVSANMTLYAKADSTMPIPIMKNSGSGDSQIYWYDYYENYADKYICFTINVTPDVDREWGGVSIDYHDYFINFFDPEVTTKEYAVKISDIYDYEIGKLAAGESFGKDPHWNSDKICFNGDGFTAENPVYSVSNAYIANSIPEDAVELISQ